MALEKTSLVFAGPPASGKGTQAARLEEEFGLVHVSTGEILRELDPEKSALNAKIHARIARGDLIDDADMSDLLRQTIESELTSNPEARFIIDGFPRTPEQVDSIEKLLNHFGHRAVLVILDVSDEEIERRMDLRLQEEDRADDGKTAVRAHRLAQFRDLTVPAMLELSERDLVEASHLIDGEMSVDDVYASIREKLVGVLG